MKFCNGLLALYCLMNSGEAFTAFQSRSSPSLITPSSALNMGYQSAPEFEMFPIYPTLETIQGARTIQTYKMPPWATKCQYRFETNGRPMKATAQLWIGPIRTTHTLEMDCEDGRETPVQGTITFKKLAPVVKVSTGTDLEFPLLCGIHVPSPARTQELEAYFDNVWDMAIEPEQKQRVQGGSTEGGGGAIRYWTVPEGVDSVQILVWSKFVGKKSFKLNVEVLEGPNNIKQKYFLQCGGSTQPYHAVFQTPKNGCVIRMQNKKFLEDGLVQVAVVPYTRWIEDGSDGGAGYPEDVQLLGGSTSQPGPGVNMGAPSVPENLRN